MADLEDKVNYWDHEWLRDRVYKLEETVRKLTERLDNLENRLTDDGK